MTDREIIQGLIDRDNHMAEEFFFVKCRPLFLSIMQRVFPYEVDYDELVNELYAYLMEQDACRLRSFQYRCSVYQWLKVLSIRYFVKKRGQMIEDCSHETPYDRELPALADTPDYSAREDVRSLFDQMPNKRYAYVIQRLVIDDCEPELLAREMNITTANLYNIKRRAMAQLTRIALNDIQRYGR